MMSSHPGRRWRRVARTFKTVAIAIGALSVLVLAWQRAPIQGQIVITSEDVSRTAVLWPRFHVEPATIRAGEPIVLTIEDIQPWAHVALTVDGHDVQLPDGRPSGGVWTWSATLSAPRSRHYSIVFYYDCDKGCAERGRFTVGTPGAPDVAAVRVPTELGVTFAQRGRDWRGRQAWDLELVYCSAADDNMEKRWSARGLSDAVQQATASGLSVLVRVAYDRQQSVPPTDDQVGLSRFVACVERLARDARLAGVYGYIIGSGFNSSDENAAAADRPSTARWYARAFNGFGVDASNTENIVQRVRSANPKVRVLVGPLTPWSDFQRGQSPSGATENVNVAPWLAYMNTLVESVDAAGREKARAGSALAAPDGFAVQAPGRLDQPEVSGQPALEPLIDQPLARWNGAQGGFRVYRDWLAIINRYATTSGQPVYISSTNTFTWDSATLPAQNYPRGWLRAALLEVQDKPQVAALIWFLDDPTDQPWEFFSLARHPGNLADAEADFEALLASN